MKKIILLSAFALVFWGVTAQEEKAPKNFLKNEFRINAFNLLLFKSFDVTYERAITAESSFGINTMFSLQGKERFDDGDYIYYHEGFTLTPYYRLYFGKKPYAGFFGEAFAVFASGQYDYWEYDYYPCYDCYSVGDYGYSLKSFTEFGVGLGFGVKLIRRPNFIVNIHGGAARNFLNSAYGPAVTPRASISFGWRY